MLFGTKNEIPVSSEKNFDRMFCLMGEMLKSCGVMFPWWSFPWRQGEEPGEEEQQHDEEDHGHDDHIVTDAGDGERITVGKGGKNSQRVNQFICHKLALCSNLWITDYLNIFFCFKISCLGSFLTTRDNAFYAIKIFWKLTLKHLSSLN